MPSRALALADSIARVPGEEARVRFLARCNELSLTVGDDALDLASLVGSAYPALARDLLARPEPLLAIARGGTKAPRDAKAYKRGIASLLSNVSDVSRALRLFAAREKLRIALREVLQNPGSDVDVTARELSDLADVCLETALTSARAWAEERFGVPTTSAGERCAFAVIGMGKLGGRELNAGSDVDLLLFYETDDGDVRKDGVPTDQTLHEHFARVAQRLTQTMDDVTEDGVVWRVDLRLRPEGSRGALVNAIAAAEGYYETWGRTWERAALLRARAVAGDLAFGTRCLEALAPFVWRRNVNPQIADEMMALAERARTELASDPARDLKLGVGGIREAEFFVQSLQLIWGGREKAVRSANTLDALRRLRARGLVTDREGQDLADAYLSLRRAEHRVQFATGLQTHSLPKDDLLETIGRSLGFASGAELVKDLDKTRRKVAQRLRSLTSARTRAPVPDDKATPSDLGKLFVAVDARDEAAILVELSPRFGVSPSPDLARHILALARRPDFPFGAKARDDFPDLAAVLVEALSDAADPEQATRLLAAFFARCPTPTVYERALAEDPRAARRLASLFGASAFLGESMVAHPELLDRLLFGLGAPDPTTARRAVDDEIASLVARDPSAVEGWSSGDVDAFVGALRRAKGGVTIEVGLADLAGDLSTRKCTLTLSELADATLEHATAFSTDSWQGNGDADVRGFAVIAMGKLGGREIGYGSDLDLFFVYESDRARDDDDDEQVRFVRRAQRVIRLTSMPHGDGPGYELDTRLRPSGNQGLLVVSLAAFARYHGLTIDGARGGDDANKPAEDWERQALLKARVCGGDRALGARVMKLARVAAYEGGAPPPERLHRMRMRMEQELAGERTESGRARYDLKLGRGGLVDVEFAVQWLQMKYGGDPRVRTTDTEAALDALEVCGYLDAQLATPLREGYRTLRRLEQRLRVLHGTSAQLIEEGAPGLPLLARRMGMRDGPRATATQGLIERYLAVTRDVRAAYLTVLEQPA